MTLKTCNLRLVVLSSWGTSLLIKSTECLSYHSRRRKICVDRLAEVDAAFCHLKPKANSRASLSWWIDGIKCMWQHSIYSLFHHLAGARSTPIYFPVPQFLFHLAVTDGDQLCLLWGGRRGRKRRKKKKSLLQHTFSWAIKHDWTFHVPIRGIRNRQIASAP